MKDWKEELSNWFFEQDYQWAKDRPWLNTMDTGVNFGEIINYIEQNFVPKSMIREVIEKHSYQETDLSPGVVDEDILRSRLLGEK